MLIGNLFQQLYSMVDAILVGRYVSGNALAAVGVTMNVVFFITSVLIGLTTGSAVVIAQFYGAKQHDKLKDTFAVSIVSLFGLAIILTVLGVTLAPTILRLLNTDPLVFDDALLYMRILLGGMICPVYYNMYIAYLRALGDSRRPLYILVFTVVLSGVLTVYLVAYRGMGIGGAAASTIFSQFIAAILCFLYSRRYVPLLRFEKLMFDFKLFVLIFRYGAPAALQFALVTLGTLIITRLINSFGAPAMAAITAVSRMDMLATMPISTLSMALSTFVAQNMGAGIEDRAIKGFRVAMLYMILFAVSISALLMVFAPQLISMFLNQSDKNYTEILDIGHRYLNIMVLFYFLFAFFYSFVGFFRGVGDAIMTMMFAVISLTFRTVSAYALVYLAGMGPEALSWSIPIGWGLSSIGCIVYYKKRLWAGKVAI